MFNTRLNWTNKCQNHQTLLLGEGAHGKDDDEGWEGSPEADIEHHRRHHPIIWALLLQVGLILATAWTTWKLAAPPPTDLSDEILTADGKSFPSGRLTWSHHFHPLPCGRTPDEALAQGCHFDLVATAWLPRRCIDDELAAEFAALHAWEYYEHRNGTGPFPSSDPDVLGSQRGPIWTTDRWHAAHCLYMWKKLNRALVRGWSTDAETVKLAHTDHCVMNIMGMGDPDRIQGVMEVIYPPC